MLPLSPCLKAAAAAGPTTGLQAAQTDANGRECAYGQRIQSDPPSQSAASFYDDPGAFERYGAHRHSGVSSPNVVMEQPAMLDALGDVRGLRIMELGCGDGQLARTVLSVSCRSYAGIDNSARMVAAAREALTGTEAVVTEGDIAAFSAAANSYDLVVSCMALHYVADLQAVLDACRACLSPGGRVLFSVVHPVITSHETPSDGAKRTSWLVDDYFEPGPRERDWMGSTVVWHHRTVEAHVTALLAAGFTLDALRECAPRRELFRGDDAEYARRQRVPLFLLLAGSVS